MKKDKGCTITLPCLQVDEVTCQTCRYFGEPYCSNVALKDAMKRIEQLEAERDAAVRDFEAFAGSAFTDSPFPCNWCAHETADGYCLNKIEAYHVEDKCHAGSKFKWRGYQPKEDNHENT